MPKLFVLSGPEVGATHAFDGDVELGRAPGVSIVLRGPSVSRRHARIQRVGERWFLEDLGSANGTTIGRRGIQREELTDGTLFELGELELRFRTDAPADPTPSGATTVLEGDSREEGGVGGSSSAPPQSPHSPGADDGGAAEGGDELELEGDWETVIPPRGTPWSPALQEPIPPRPASRAPSPGGPDQEDLSETRTDGSSVGPSSVRQGRDRRRAPAPGATPAPSPAGSSEAGASARNRILQYRQVRDRQGFVSADLSQYPAWIRGLVLLLALALFLAVAYGAFRLTTTLRGGSGAEVSQPQGD